MKAVNLVTLILLIVGGLNWGLVGVFGFDLVAALFGEMSVVARIVYTLVGLCAVVQIVLLSRCCAGRSTSATDPAAAPQH